jgi:hypothetical protein
MGVNLPIQNYFEPKPVPTDWVRPFDWPVITDASNEVQFLLCDINLATFTIRTTFTRTTGNIYIDWGDGSPVDTITSTGIVLTSHTYTIGTGTPCSRGYTTFKVRVYGDPTCVIQRCQPIAPVGAGSALSYQMGLLEAYYGDNTSTLTTSAPNYGGISSAASVIGGFDFLEYVKLPTSVSWNTATTFMFSQNQGIQKVVIPTTVPNTFGFRHFFSGCTNLRGEYVLPASYVPIGNNLEAMFQGCRNVTKVVFPNDLTNITTLNSTFNGCTSLKTMTLSPISNVTDLSSVFRDCISLEWVKLEGLPAPASTTSINMGNMFNGCVTLENIYLPATCSSNARYDCTIMFGTCNNLKSVIFPVGFEATSLSQTFFSCSSITTIKFQNGFSACTNINTAFNACRNLYDLTLPPTLGATATAQNVFSLCSSLESITIPNTYNLTGSLVSIFNGCTSVKTINLPNTSQDGITSLITAFQNCTKLETVTLPSSMTGVTDLSNTFSECNNLKSVVFPTTMNSVTTMNACFLNCYSLESVTMPTSMSSCSNFNSTFIRNRNLQSLTMPATVGPGTNWITAFFQCSRLKTLTLPTTQTTTLTGLNQFVESCGSLATITNTDKLGSTGATPLVNLTQNVGANLIPSLTFTCPMSILAFNGTSSTGTYALSSLRLLNTSSGQWTGTSPQINVSFTSLSTAALVQLFNDMAAQGIVTSKTINITSATGAAGLTAADRLIITSKGWTIVG